METLEPVMKPQSWTTRRDEKRRRMAKVEPMMRGLFLPTGEVVSALEALIASGDRVVVEGDNQKQADFLSCSLAAVDPQKIHHLHLIISSISRPEHLTLFEFGIAEKVDFAFAGPQSLRLAHLLDAGKLSIGC
jgi:malonate decarboxylase alpha subunit